MGKLSCPVRESKNYKEKENFTEKKKQQRQQIFQKTTMFVFLQKYDKNIIVRGFVMQWYQGLIIHNEPSPK